MSSHAVSMSWDVMVSAPKPVCWKRPPDTGKTPRFCSHRLVHAGNSRLRLRAPGVPERTPRRPRHEWVSVQRRGESQAGGKNTLIRVETGTVQEKFHMGFLPLCFEKFQRPQ